MHLSMVTLFIINMVITHGNEFYKKCCKSGEYLAENKSLYTCVKAKPTRLAVLTNETNFLEANADGECADVDEDFFIFKVVDGKIVKKTSIVEKYFPKCCPLNYHYDSFLHSCQGREDMEHSFIKENFVKVGLPNCKVIIDHVLNESLDNAYNVINETSGMLSNDLLQKLGSFCIDKTETDSFVLRECRENLDVCEDVKCVKKCCPDGQSFINRSQCFDTFTHGLNLSTFSAVDKPTDPYAVISNRTCPKIYMMPEKKYVFHLDDKGTFRYWQDTSKSFINEAAGHLRSYCIEHTKTRNFDGYLFFMCFREPVISAKFAYTMWPKIFSCIFLLLTIIIYLILRETKNVFGKILINYCIALLCQNGVLTYAQVSLHPSKIDCILRCLIASIGFSTNHMAVAFLLTSSPTGNIIMSNNFLGFSIIFFTTAAFSWSNIVCYDIWRTFGSTKRTFVEYPRNKTFKKMILYILYGWGVPAIVTLIIYLLHNYKVVPDSIQPLLAMKKCFFDRKEGNYAQGLFFNLPHLIIQLVNTFFFVKTVLYCLKVKNEIDKINDTTKDDKNKNFQKDKERLFLILKLSIIMGVSFMFEIVSAFFDMKQMGAVSKYIEVVWDTVNCLQGVFIFIIFICKKKIYRDLLRKFKVFVPSGISSPSFHTQSTTISSGIFNKVINDSNE